MKPAGWLEDQPFMKVNLGTMPTHGDVNIRMPCGWKLRRVLYGSTVYSNIKDKRLNFP